jgi:hypothetical protein
MKMRGFDCIWRVLYLGQLQSVHRYFVLTAVRKTFTLCNDLSPELTFFYVNVLFKRIPLTVQNM